MWPTALLVLFLALQSNYHELGLKALDEKRYQDAVDNFINAIAAEPQDYTLHFNLALAYSLMGKDADAIPQYKKALEIKPGLYQAELNLGILLIRDKQGAEAVPLLTDAAGQKAKEFRPNLYLASALLASGDFAKAEQAYKTALEIDPKSPDAELGLAHALAKQDKLADAAPHFQNAASLNPNYRDGLLELAALYEAAKQAPEAIAIYQKFPDNPGAQERMGALLLASGQAKESIERFQAAVAESPTPANRAALATAYLKNKEPDKALPVIEKVLAADPERFGTEDAARAHSSGSAKVSRCCAGFSGCHENQTGFGGSLERAGIGFGGCRGLSECLGRTGSLGGAACGKSRARIFPGHRLR